ncbi:MAG: hypothetical protein HQK55_00150 [Deltaproteobacteria bacterium]|nr:hypothetical protein [Deltaproteobacteria bacterium]
MSCRRSIILWGLALILVMIPGNGQTYGGIVFLGDSLTAGGKWSEFFPEHHITNLGVVSDSTAGVLNRLDEVVKQRPEKVFIMIGVNDLGAGVTVPEITDRYAQIIRQLTSKLPKTRFYLQSVLPVNRQLYRRKLNPDHIMAVNYLLQSLAGRFRATYIDLFSRFSTPDRQLHREYTTDGVHLNARGYQIWKDCIEEDINE